MEIYIGCSGYYYNHWKGAFYPEDLPRKQWLSYYSQYFNTVEINNTFYRMPDEKSVINWHAITPPGFVFAVKGYRFLTHQKKFNTDDIFVRYLNDFHHIAGLLKEKAGPLLWQLPRNFTVNTGKLEKFCSLLSREFEHVFEFRHESWFSRDVFGILEKHGHNLCIISGPGTVPQVIRATGKTAYIRFHGEGSWYNDNYSDEALESWKLRLDSVNAARLFAYFNNDINAYAINNGRYFASLYKHEKAGKVNR